MNDPRWLAQARTYLGQRERPGVEHNPLIVRWWSLIRAPYTDDETPWCAGFVGGNLEICGIRSTRSAAARSYLKWGVPLPFAALGCIVVFKRGADFGHVGFCVGRRSDGALMILGGNQGDAVSIAAFPLHRVLFEGYRWPAGEPLPDISVSLPVLAHAGGVSTNEA